MPLPKALSPLESAFLHVEGARTPMHIGSIGIFEGPPLRDDQGHLRMEEIRERIGTRLALVPKLRQRPHPPVLPGAPAIWVDDPTFDLSRHCPAGCGGLPLGRTGGARRRPPGRRAARRPGPDDPAIVGGTPVGSIDPGSRPDRRPPGTTP